MATKRKRRKPLTVDQARKAVNRLPGWIYVESYMENAHDSGLHEESEDDGLAFWTEVLGQAVADNNLYGANDMPERLTIRESISPAVLKMYGGMPHGDDAIGVWDIEFPDIHAATLWAHSCGIMSRVHFRDPITRMTGAVVVQVWTVPTR